MSASPGVLVDTSIWADHFRRAEPPLVALLAAARVRMHPFVLGELAMGRLSSRARVIALLDALPALGVVDEPAWLAFVDDRALPGSGLGFVDAHLLAAAAEGRALLWTRDRRLHDRAVALGIGWEE